MIDFKLAQLRKEHNLTQQELGEILNVSYQTISKWETGATYPDLSMLPHISAYFGVTVDALLGLAPLEDTYRPSDSGTAEYWEHRLEYLLRTRKTMWNRDYMAFLIRDVWNIREPVTVLDCGCGYGALGLLMMPLLPPGSKYVGIDFSRNMLDAAEKYYRKQMQLPIVEYGAKGAPFIGSEEITSDKTYYRNSDISAEFILSDILHYEPKEKYSLVISQAVLRHVDDGEALLRKMAGFVADGGILVSLECNREFEADGLYIRGMDYMELCRHEGLKKLWKTELEKQNRDYSIAMKIPHYMKAAGLKNVSCRMNDRVTFLEPEQPDYSELLESVIKADHWDDEKTDREIEENIAYFMNHGMDRKEAEDYCRQMNGIVKYLKKHEGNVSLTKAAGIMISYGWK